DQGGAQRRLPRREREGLDPLPERRGPPTRHPHPVAPEHRAEHADIPRPRPDQRLAYGQLRPHRALGRRGPMRDPVRAQPARVRQRPRIAPIRLHPPAPGGVHGGEIRIRHDHLVAQRRQRLRDPFALGGCLEHHPGAIPSLEERREPPPSRAHAALQEHSPVLGDDADLALRLMHVDPDVLPGWPPSVGWWGRGLPLGTDSQPLHPICCAPAPRWPRPPWRSGAVCGGPRGPGRPRTCRKPAGVVGIVAACRHAAPDAPMHRMHPTEREAVRVVRRLRESGVGTLLIYYYSLGTYSSLTIRFRLTRYSLPCDEGAVAWPT